MYRKIATITQPTGTARRGITVMAANAKRLMALETSAANVPLMALETSAATYHRKRLMALIPPPAHLSQPAWCIAYVQPGPTAHISFVKRNIVIVIVVSYSAPSSPSVFVVSTSHRYRCRLVKTAIIFVIFYVCCLMLQ